MPPADVSSLVDTRERIAVESAMQWPTVHKTQLALAWAKEAPRRPRSAARHRRQAWTSACVPLETKTGLRYPCPWRVWLEHFMSRWKDRI